MEAKKQMVKLVTDEQEAEFEISHAERILKMPNNGGWKLPKDSQFKFDNDGIGIRNNKNRDQRAERESGDKQSDQSPE